MNEPNVIWIAELAKRSALSLRLMVKLLYHLLRIY